MIELFIENQRVDISQEVSTLLSYSIDDVRDFGAKNTTVSKTVVLPGTKRNNALFGSIFEVSGANSYDPTKPNINVNFNAAVSARMILFQDNIQAVKGIVQMLQVVNDRGFIDYEVGLFGELAGFTAKLGNKKLEDLDFSAYNQTYSLANIVASWNNAAGGSGLYYPLIDYGTYSLLKKDWDYRTFRPALFAKEYIDKIFAATGYTYDCALFGSTRFKSIIVPHNQKLLQKKSSNQLDISVTPSNSYAFNADGSSNNLDIAIKTLLGSFAASAGDTIYTYSGSTVTGTVTINFDVVLNATFIDGDCNLRLTLFNSLGIGIASINVGAASGGNVENLIGTSNGSVTVSNGDYFVLNSDGFDSSIIGTPQYYILVNSLNITFGNTGTNFAQVNIGESIIINDTIPKNILQKEFISSILKLFNCYLFEDQQEDKLLKIEPFVDFYASAPVIDWTYKIDRSRPIIIKPMSELNSRYFEFNYKKDTDYYNDLYEKRYNQTYGSYLYDSEYEFAKETTKVELIFSGTPLVGYTGEEKVYSTIYKKSNNNEETIDSNIRLLQAKKITSVASWDIKDSTTVLGSYTDYGYAGHLNDPDAPSNDLGFGVPKELFFTLVTGALNVNQFNVYWSSYMAEITDKDSRLMTCTARLRMQDILNLSFKNLINIDGVLFRLNKILDYNVNTEDTCKVELLKLINRIY